MYANLATVSNQWHYLAALYFHLWCHSEPWRLHLRSFIPGMDRTAAWVCTEPRSSGGDEVSYPTGNRTPVAQGTYRRSDTDNYSSLNYTFVVLAAVTMEMGVLRKKWLGQTAFPASPRRCK